MNDVGVGLLHEASRQGSNSHQQRTTSYGSLHKSTHIPEMSNQCFINMARSTSTIVTLVRSITLLGQFGGTFRASRFRRDSPYWHCSYPLQSFRQSPFSEERSS
jgi:hypothetical protein